MILQLNNFRTLQKLQVLNSQIVKCTSFFTMNVQSGDLRPPTYSSGLLSVEVRSYRTMKSNAPDKPWLCFICGNVIRFEMQRFSVPKH